jgi:hypothetical protein
MHPLQMFYNLLQINRKIENVHIRLMYLKDIWGMEQKLIGACEGISQSYVSKELIYARKTVPRETFLEQTSNIWTSEEIQFLQFLPREVVTDIQVLAFIEDILHVYPNHSFYQHYEAPINLRIAALASLGIQHKRVGEIFNKNQPTISMNVKRHMEKALETERPNRYEKSPTYTLMQQPFQSKFTKAGGQN